VFGLPVAASLVGRREATAAARAAVGGVPGLAVVGAAFAGAGLAQVIPDAVAEADRVRRAVVFGTEKPSAD
jgi:oxygen-dependent protoporphyrinogen oxidase